MEENKNIMIHAEDISRAFPVGNDLFWGLKHIDMDICSGELTILKGRSGSGKTTLLNILSALDRPTEGKLFLDGQDVTAMSDGERDLLRRGKIGYIYQSVALIPMMSAYENVEFALRLAEKTPEGKARLTEGRRKRAEDCLHMVGLGSRMSHMPQEMSGGEQQRVAIARAIASRPLVLFADEPTAELDTNTGLQVVKIFKDLCRAEGVTIVMTTHDTGLMDIGDRVYELEDGEVIGHKYE
ncbi:MAG: ABC transporter ATP-binding protein [Lachnospiraceae bacterium]|nr:ABC transporter ATP-binding protein [Lachnospiraceae bacterium]